MSNLRNIVKLCDVYEHEMADVGNHIMIHTILRK